VNTPSPEQAVELETALSHGDPIARDGARARLAARSEPAVLAELARQLDAPDRITRRRAGRLLGECKPARVRPVLLAVIEAPVTPDRHRAAAVRLLALLSPQGEPALGALLHDSSARVRRAAATPAAPREALTAALHDPDAGVAGAALDALIERDWVPAVPVLTEAFARHGDALASLRRLLARAEPNARWLVSAAAAGDDAALDHLDAAALAPADFEALLRAAPDAARRRALIWAAARGGRPDAAWAEDPDPEVRAALARHLPPDAPALMALARDPEPAVAWLAAANRAAMFDDGTIARRTAPHARLDAPSARPPYGLRPDDAVTSPPRVDAALALCHTRFDVNLGVAVRSAEAAGLSEVYLVGRGEMLRSPARGTENVVPVTPVADAAALIRRARETGRQLVAVQQTPVSVPYHRAIYPPRPLFVLGAEDEGVPAALRRAADLLVEIPQWGVIDSLNVAAAATCVLFHWRAHRDG
jgi:tRNA(Leu) C34 or U34 (ribose-2'-O)-methylase TrmL